MEKKREILEEKIKQALTSTYKVISDQLRYKKPNAKTTDIKSLDFSEIKDLKTPSCRDLNLRLLKDKNNFLKNLINVRTN